MMDDNRRKILYAQLKLILIELLWDRKPLPKKLEQADGQADSSVLKIHVTEKVGSREQMM